MIVEGWRSYEVGLRDENEGQVVGITAPDFEGTTMTGDSWKLSAARGLLQEVSRDAGLSRP